MRCPKCFTQTLESYEVDGQNFTIEKCSRCGGLWFDGEELEQSLGEFAEKALTVPRDSKLTPLACPHCKRQLYSFKYPHTYATIEMCKACRGIWLDKDEFEEIAVVREHHCHAVSEPAPKASAKSRLLSFINEMLADMTTFN